ncbi:MAG: type II toxin-antitoxin system RelE/ParE family toxin [Bacteroidota bacterium]|nr:type II toxin-antitoxin system RelE/ParE family toxin [Bacteroidota bacterium]
MDVRYKKAFIKDLEKIPDDIKQAIQEIVFIKIPRLTKLADISGLKKIKGYKNYFRINVKDYRIGFKFFDEEVIFYRVLHRKEIYRYFP